VLVLCVWVGVRVFVVSVFGWGFWVCWCGEGLFNCVCEVWVLGTIMLRDRRCVGFWRLIVLSLVEGVLLCGCVFDGWVGGGCGCLGGGRWFVWKVLVDGGNVFC